MIEFVRGDSFPFYFGLNHKDGTPVTMSEIDTLFITCRIKPDSAFPVLFKKTKDDVTLDEQGNCHVLFEPKDTEELEYGFYCFDIEVTLMNGYRKTALHEFNLTKESTTHKDGVVNEN